MAGPDPSHPDHRAEHLAGNLRPVSLAGSGTTIGDGSRLAALKGGMDTSSPLLEAYRRWKTAQEADDQALKSLRADIEAAERRLVTATKADRDRARDHQAKKAAKRLKKARKAAALASPAAIEARALRKSLKRTRDALPLADDASTALQVGFRHYRNQGGTASFAMWKRKLVS